MNRQSAKGRAYERELAVARMIVATRCGGRCEGRTEVCTGRMEHIHHVRLRSQGGDNSPANLRGLCLKCHDWAHRNPKEANVLGLIEMRKYA